jgi:hypothetical protein
VPRKSREKSENQREDASQEKRETQATDATYGKLRVQVECYYACQEHRIKAGNRIWALQDRLGLSKEEMQPLHDFLDSRMKEMERRLQAMVKKELKGELAFEGWLGGIRGIGPCLGGGLIAWIGDPGRFDTPSALWKYCGMDVVNGKAPHRARGEKATWNPTMRTLCWKVGESFVKQGEGYRALYDQFKAAYQQSHGPGNLSRLHIHAGVEGPHRVGQEHEDGGEKYTMDGKPLKAGATRAHTAAEWHGFELSDGHIHAMAKRKTVKVFLAHLWQRWRELKGMPTRAVYVVEKLGHEGQIPVIER